MIAKAFGPTFCSSSFVPKSTLLHKPEAQYGLVPKLSHHERQKQSPFGLKNQECSLRTKTILCFSDSPESLFLLFDSFDVRKDMFCYWQEDGGSVLPTRFMTIAEQMHEVQNYQKELFRFLLN